MVLDEVYYLSDALLETTSVDVPLYLYWSGDVFPAVNIGGTQRRSTLGSSVSLDSLARTSSVNMDICYSIRALDLAMTCVRVPLVVDKNTEDWGDVVADSGIFLVDDGDCLLLASVTYPGWLHAMSTDVQASRSARARAYSTSHVGKGLPSSGRDDARNNTILAFDFPDNMPHGCVLPDELLLASCL